MRASRARSPLPKRPAFPGTLLAVVQDGRLYTREMLDAQQARYREDFDGFFQRRIATPFVRAVFGIIMSRTMGAGVAST